MSNTWNGMTFTNIAREGFDALLQALVPLTAFTRDFSTDVPQGTKVQSRIVAASTADDLTSDHSGDYSEAAKDSTTTQIEVTLNKRPVDGFNLTDTEAQNIGAGVWSDTAQRIVRTKAYSVAKSYLDDVFGLITDSNYGSAKVTTSAATFDVDDVVKLRQEAVSAGWLHSPENSVMVLNPALYAALLKDGDIKNYSSSQSDALRSGELPRLAGFRVIEAPTLPGNNENLVGFTAQVDCIAVALRAVQSQASGDFEAFEILQDDVTGVVMTYAAWFDRNYRKMNHSFELFGGASKANGDALHRIVSTSGLDT